MLNGVWPHGTDVKMGQGPNVDILHSKDGAMFVINTITQRGTGRQRGMHEKKMLFYYYATKGPEVRYEGPLNLVPHG